MDKLLKTIPITFQKIQNYEISDIRFTKVKITLMHLGLNLNNSIFTKDVVEKALPSICNTPILGYVRVKEDGEKDFSDHHSVLIIEGKEIKMYQRKKLQRLKRISAMKNIQVPSLVVLH